MCLCVIYDGSPVYGIMKCSMFSNKLKAFMESVESHNQHIGLELDRDFQQRETLTALVFHLGVKLEEISSV